MNFYEANKKYLVRTINNMNYHIYLYKLLLHGINLKLWHLLHYVEHQAENWRFLEVMYTSKGSISLQMTTTLLDLVFLLFSKLHKFVNISFLDKPLTSDM